MKLFAAASSILAAGLLLPTQNTIAIAKEENDINNISSGRRKVRAPTAAANYGHRLLAAKAKGKKKHQHELQQCEMDRTSLEMELEKAHGSNQMLREDNDELQATIKRMQNELDRRDDSNNSPRGGGNLLGGSNPTTPSPQTQSPTEAPSSISSNQPSYTTDSLEKPNPMRVGDRLEVDYSKPVEYIMSNNNQFKFALEYYNETVTKYRNRLAHYYVGNGNNELLWYSSINENEAKPRYLGEFPGYAEFQYDRNFVLYVNTISYNDKEKFPFLETLTWATNTANQGSNESELVVQDDGNVVTYEKSNMKGKVLWSTKPVEDYEFDFDDDGKPREVRFNVATGDFRKFDVPVSGTYYLEVVGGQGGNVGVAKGGRGAILSGYFDLTKGDVLRVAVGGKGESNKDLDDKGFLIDLWGGGGGGASSVVLVDGDFDSLADEDNTKLIIAGGGGGAGNNFEGK